MAVPLLPLMFLQARRIRKKVPVLAEAREPEGKVLNETDREFRLICIGESSMAGVGVGYHREAFAGTLARHLSEGLKRSVKWRVYARSGYTAAMISKKLIPGIEETEADLIVIMTGGNDAFTLNRPWRWEADIRHIIVSLEERFGPTPVIFTNMPPVRDFPAFTPVIRFVVGNLTDIFGRILARVSKSYSHVGYASETIRLDEWVSKLGVGYKPDDFFSDGVHPSSLTYQTWAREMAAFILSK